MNRPGATERSITGSAAFYRAMYRRLPSYWRLKTAGHDGGGSFMHALVQYSAIISCAEERDGRLWIHFSMATPPGAPPPPWDVLKAAKEAFLGDVEAYLVFPPRARYVNIHPNALHLWHCLEGPAPLPDFTATLPDGRISI